MGFGTLFIGYFLLLNFAYCDFSDAIAGVLILYALYKLSGINNGFKRSFAVSVLFTLLGVVELVIVAYDTFIPLPTTSPLFTAIALVRHLLVAFMTVFILSGIREVSEEVALPALAEKSRRLSILTIGIYALNIILESVSIASILNGKTLVLLGLLTILATLTLTVLILTAIFTAYMRICMPEDLDMKERESRFAFVNAFRRHEEEKRREYAEYKLGQLKEKQAKKERKEAKEGKTAKK